jgi:hypothetical protein
MGLDPEGGLLRVSLAGSTGLDEIERFTSALHELLEATDTTITATPETATTEPAERS